MQSRRLFWALSPYMVVFIVAMPFLVDVKNTQAAFALGGMEIAATMLLLGLYDSDRFYWAFRVLGGMIFLFCFISFVVMAIQRQWMPQRGGNLGALYSLYSLLWMFFFGWPALRFAICGRLPDRNEPFENDHSDEEYEMESCEESDSSDAR